MPGVYTTTYDTTNNITAASWTILSVHSAKITNNLDNSAPQGLCPVSMFSNNTEGSLQYIYREVESNGVEVVMVDRHVARQTFIQLTGMCFLSKTFY